MRLGVRLNYSEETFLPKIKSSKTKVLNSRFAGMMIF
jgi:hypothetical protein